MIFDFWAGNRTDGHYTLDEVELKSNFEEWSKGEEAQLKLELWPLERCVLNFLLDTGDAFEGKQLDAIVKVCEGAV